MVAIVDYGVCNTKSIYNMLRKAGSKDCVITSNPSVIENASLIVLPGVGSYDAGMSSLKNLHLIEVLLRKANSGTPILGICLGMQMLGVRSEEGTEDGLGLVDFECLKFDPLLGGGNCKIPHMGWDAVRVAKQDSPLSVASSPSVSRSVPRYYFVHSYYAKCENKDNIIMTCTYSGVEFAAAVQQDNVFGVQFHPEKSHSFGLALLKNYLDRIT